MSPFLDKEPISFLHSFTSVGLREFSKKIAKFLDSRDTLSSPFDVIPQENMPDDLNLWYHEHIKPHEPMLRAWLRSRYHCEHEAEDIVQESVIKVLEVQRTRNLASPKAYLYATARNAALMRFRKISVRKHVSLADFEDMDIVADESPDVIQKAAKGEELEMLTRAVQSLPKRCRQVMTLRKIYGMSQKKTAQQLGISENTVESQIAIGSRKIGEFFDRHEIR